MFPQLHTCWPGSRIKYCHAYCSTVFIDKKIIYLSSLLLHSPRISCYFHLKHVGIFESIQQTVMFSINRYVTKEILLLRGYLVFEVHEKVSARYKDIPQDSIMSRHFKFCSVVTSLFTLF